MRSEADLDFSRLYVFGAGGHGREVAWLAESAWAEIPEIVFLVDDPRYLVAAVDGHAVRLFADEVLEPDSRYLVAVGDPASRRRIAADLDSRGARAATLVHPSAVLSPTVALGAGAIVFPGCVVTTEVTVGRHAHLNLACTVSHSSSIGDFTSLSPGVHVAGNVSIGAGVFVGVGASFINGSIDQPLVVGDGAVVAAGATVIGTVAAGALVAGVPAVRKR